MMIRIFIGVVLLSAFAGSGFLLTGCQQKMVLTADQTTVNPGEQLHLSAVCTPAPAAGSVTFHWIAQGKVDPREGSSPRVTYTAPLNTSTTTAMIDTVKCTARLHNGAVLEAETTIMVNPRQYIQPQITINADLPYSHRGSDTTVVPVKGSVSGDLPTRAVVVLYTITNRPYIQPFEDDFFTNISPDGTFATQIHPGREYVALLVDRTVAEAMGDTFPLQSVPAVDQKVVYASARVKGKR